jgi:hypothetical protein
LFSPVDQQSTSAYSELQKQHLEALATIEELSQTAAEEIEQKSLDIEKKTAEIARLTSQVSNKNQVTEEYEVCSLASTHS